MSYEISDFIGVFDNVISKDDCAEIIRHYEHVCSLGRTQTRRQHENAAPINKDNSLYFLTPEDQDQIITTANTKAINQFKMATWECYRAYAEEYGILSSIASHGMPEMVKIQKTKPCEGYHIWHCENASVNTGTRVFLVLVYLNDVEEGGETEFLYQSKRVAPKAGRLLLCPAGFTHTHRGNPPLSGTKYVMNTWMQFLE